MLIEIILRYCLFAFSGLGVLFMVWLLWNLWLHDKPRRKFEPEPRPEPQPRKHRQAGPYARYVT